MTDKQIIIDGVDVSGCEYYFDEKCRCMDASIMQDFYLCPQCNNNPNCSYKNWKSKEQECDRLNEEIKNKLVIYKEIKEKSAVFTSEFSLACGAITALEWVLNLEVKNEH